MMYAKKASPLAMLDLSPDWVEPEECSYDLMRLPIAFFAGGVGLQYCGESDFGAYWAGTKEQVMACINAVAAWAGHHTPLPEPAPAGPGETKDWASVAVFGELVAVLLANT